MDDYYRKLFKSLHKNKEEMLRLMEEQSLFQLSQVGLKVCDQTLYTDLRFGLCCISSPSFLTIFTLLVTCNADQRIAEGAQPGACVIDVGPKPKFGSRRPEYAAEAKHAVTTIGSITIRVLQHHYRADGGSRIYIIVVTWATDD